MAEVKELVQEHEHAAGHLGALEGPAPEAEQGGTSHQFDLWLVDCIIYKFRACQIKCARRMDGGSWTWVSSRSGRT